MSGNKAALKAAKTALDGENYEDVITQCQIVLASDAQNYFAKLFLGRAFQKLNRLDEAAKTYNSAAQIKPEDTQAWLGLCNLYESQGGVKLDEYREVAIKVGEIFAAADDAHRCQTVINKLVDFTREHGSTAQYKRALEVQLPGSPLYSFLEGRLPHPSHTYIRLIELTEEEEKQRINKEIGERRTRLGARINQVTTDVRREVFAKSNLEELYQNLIDWSNDDEVRREYEQKLFQRAYDTLVVLSGEAKAEKRKQVMDIAHGMVIIKHPFLLAWSIELDWKDIVAIADLDVGVLREYLEFFAETSLGKVLKAYLDCEISPFPALPKDPENKEDEEPPLNQEDRILLMSDGLEDGDKSVLAHRLVADYYLHLEEHESAIDVARNGLKLLESEIRRSGLTLQDNKDAFNSTLATALVHYQSPKNHPEARTLFNDILERKSKHTSALIGLGLILEEQEEFDEAVHFLSQALEQDPSNVRIGIETAWCDALRGNFAPALEAMEKYLPELKTDDPKGRELRAQTLYRTGICMWQLDNSKAARKDRNGAYARFLSAIKTNVNFAPAYTSLGFYYADYGKDKKRARQCFQKAFELSGSEVEAAERLARSFADQGDWDIVEIVAQRVVDSGKVRPPPGSKKKGISWPFSALGVVQMTKQEYSKAIVSFLSALRISPLDYHSYVGLGESYHNSGRYNSASRTFIHAEEPHDGVSMNVTGQSWFTRYMLANVNRELGEHDEAITGLEEVLGDRPEEFGVLIALLQTFVEKAWRCIETGFLGEAAHSAVHALELAQRIAEQRPEAFNLWKAVGDACSVFYWVQDRLDLFPAESMKQLLGKEIDTKEFSILSEIDGVDSITLESAADNTSKPLPCPQYLAISLLAYKRAIFSSAVDIHAQAVAWYNLGWAEHKAFSCSDAKNGKKFLRAAVRCFKRAIELEAGNSEFWNTLGVVTTKLNPKVAQHAFVRSLHLNERSAKTWVNLGTLYLMNSDFDLAHQAFGRAQATDPDYAHAWLGEGLIALLMGDSKEALSHFTHAFEISDSSSLISKRQYAVSVFDNLLANKSTPSETTSLIQPLFALGQLHTQVPTDQPFNHLTSLFLERVGDHTTAIEMLTQLCTTAESDYEASESLSSLARFALSKADVARNQLAARDFETASENANTALDLSAEAESSGLDSDSRRKLRLSAHLTLGLAAFYLQNMDDAIAAFKSALEESDANPDVVCLLVQVLWAKGGEQEKAVAREQLFDCIEKHESHVPSIVLLGAIAALDDDIDTIEAVRDDLASLRTGDNVSVHDRGHVEQVLASIAGLASNASHEDALLETQRAIMLAPHQTHGWTQLADLTEESYPAQMALLTAQRTVPPYGDLAAEDLAKAFAGTGVVRDAQRAIVLAPWDQSGWETFADAVLA